MQTKTKSWLEALTNVIVGYLVTVTVSPLIYWINNVEVNFTQMNGIVVCFTIVSVVRQYVIRRFFNNKIDNS